MNGGLIQYLKSNVLIAVIQLNFLKMRLPAVVLDVKVLSKIQMAIMAAANGVLLPQIIKETCVLNLKNQRIDLLGVRFSST